MYSSTSNNNVKIIDEGIKLIRNCIDEQNLKELMLHCQKEPTLEIQPSMNENTATKIKTKNEMQTGNKLQQQKQNATKTKLENWKMKLETEIETKMEMEMENENRNLNENYNANWNKNGDEIYKRKYNWRLKMKTGKQNYVNSAIQKTTRTMKIENKKNLIALSK